MKKSLTAFFGALSIATLAVAPVQAAPCKDAKGKFTKCPDKKPVKKAPCKDAKGKFIKCPK
ncbi:MAG: hypothetical protein ACO1NM_08495 [Sphingobium phenoxybenzoativorans]